MGKKLIVKETLAKRALGKSGLPELDYTLNPYVGCSHSCIYCYAIDYTYDKEVASNWGSIVIAKVNLIDILKKESRKLSRGIVGLSTITDPYQAIEAKYKLTRRSIELLSREGFRISIQTKSPLVVRDTDIIENNRQQIDVGFTITTMNQFTARIIEPSTPPPISRVKALEKISSTGVDTWVFLGPIIPGINDSYEHYSEVVDVAAETNSRIIFDKFTAYRGALALMKEKLGEKQVDKILLSLKSGWWKHVSDDIEKECVKRGVRLTTQSENWFFENERYQKKLF